MKEVLPRIFLGDTNDAYSLEGLTRNEVRTIVNCAKDHPNPFAGHFMYVNFPLVDDETDNVLVYVDEAFQSLQAATEQRGENVLVHCVNGVSRSVAIVVGYLMKLRYLPFENAYATIKEGYREANMAENFQEQLRDYGASLQWDMNLNTQTHRMYRAKHRIAGNGNVVPGSFRYLCRKCRESLFLDSQTLVDSTSGNLRVECMQWMAPQVDEQAQGPLACPRCGSKLGQFSWMGLLGDYGTPAFMITGSRVDKMPLESNFKGDAFPKTRF